MKVIILLPLLILFSFLVFLGGWVFLDWSLTGILPSMIALVALFVASLAWSMTRTQPLKTVNALILILVTVVSLCLIFHLTGVDFVWEFLILSLLLAIQLFLADTSRRFKSYSGVTVLLLYLPLILTAYGAFALFMWNGSLLPAWIGLPISIVLSLFSLLTGSEKGASPRRRR